MPDGVNRHPIRPCPLIPSFSGLVSASGTAVTVYQTRYLSNPGGICAASTGKAHQQPGKNNRTSDKPLCGRNPPNSTNMQTGIFIMAKFYCKYCGNAYSSVQSLTSTTCSRHPDGVGKGRHALYEGDEAPEYTCKYCGKRASTIASLTSQMCPRHPDGNGKGRHSPSL